MKPKDFQENSAGRIVNLFNDGHKRVLLADEVGLGKTIVSRAVVEKMYENARQNNQSFNVVYVCSNQGIIRQNAHKLGIPRDKVMPLSESRLSMLHKNLFIRQDDYLIPITPSTSLKQNDSYGNANERALIFLLICEDFLEELHDQLKSYLDVYSSRGKNKRSNSTLVNKMTFQFRKLEPYCWRKDNENYYNFIRGKLSDNKKYKKIIEKISSVINGSSGLDHSYINELRSIFCNISMDMLKPNLVIMDEFQRYRDLMVGTSSQGNNIPKTEENILAQRFFNDTNTYILLVSATPYKPMTTMEEISLEGGNSNFEDFNNLMCFLMGQHEEMYNGFKEHWKKYSTLLGTLSASTLQELIKAKEAVESMLRKVMVRTERYMPNLAIYVVEKVMPTSGEVNEYKRLRKLIDCAEKKNSKSPKPILNIDYVKSSPYLLSFMQNYAEKSYIAGAYDKLCPKPEELKAVLENDMLKSDELLNGNVKIDCRNARLKYLYDLVFGKGKKRGMVNLLWIPASVPYYETKGPFRDYADASKVLVFSKWGFVPRMIAAMLSHASQFGNSKVNGANDSNALEEYKELLLSGFPNLAGEFQCAVDNLKNNGKEIKESSLRDEIKRSLKERLKRDYGANLREATRRSYPRLLLLAKLLNGDGIKGESLKVLYWNENMLDDLANLIIASPGICLYRCFGEAYTPDSGLFKFAKSFVNMLGDNESQAVIKNNVSEKTYKLGNTLRYCVMGNLQAVIDEYAFAMGYSKEADNNDELWLAMQSAIIKRASIEIDTVKIDTADPLSPSIQKTSVQRWFACDYAAISHDDGDEKRKQSVQAAFNSPFRPFVLATTSVGQEGLDFHLYCRKVLHWNLPRCPISLEQRSGRINRYAGLAIRRSVAHMFPNCCDWNKLFEVASNEWHKKFQGYNDMVPYWCIPKECLNDEECKGIEYIENIFPLYAMSKDFEEYGNLKKQLDLYRLTLGQPDQEFIINLLDKLELSEGDKEKLTFRLSPSDVPDCSNEV